MLREIAINYHGRPDQNAIEVLLDGERHQHKGTTTNLHNEQLSNEDSPYNKQKEIVIKEVLEDIQLIFLEFAAVEEVKHLQKDEDIKKDTEMLSIVRVPLFNSQSNRAFNSKQLGSFE